MTEREKMLAGLLYDCADRELLTQWHKAKNLIREFNQMDSADIEGKNRILHSLLGGHGKDLWITPPFFVDYGNNFFFGNNCEVNMNCTFLDDNKITIGVKALPLSINHPANILAYTFLATQAFSLVNKKCGKIFWFLNYPAFTENKKARRQNITAALPFCFLLSAFSFCIIRC